MTTKYVDREIKHLWDKINLILSKNDQALRLAKKRHEQKAGRDEGSKIDS